MPGKLDHGLIESTLTLLQHLFRDYHPRDFAVRLWDGTVWHAEKGQPVLYTLVINHPGSLRSMFLYPSERSMGEAYICNDFDIEGDIEPAFRMADYLLGKRIGLGEKFRLGRFLFRLPGRNKPCVPDRGPRLSGSRHTAQRDRQAVTYHYDVSNDFYALWLDRTMTYSCAYFDGVDDDLDTAQQHKLDYICRKLRLKSGESMLDIGCGWGGLVLHATQNYGVDALGITLSRPQADFANERILRAGLAGHCRVEVRDYRNLTGTRQFDKVASVGMFEHVGEKLLPHYFGLAWRLLRPGGVFLNHGIACGQTDRAGRGASFIERYVFPDGELTSLGTTLLIAEQSGFEVRDVENLREHYTLTLRHWVERLENSRETAINFTSDTIYRIWRLYMSGSAYGFKTGRVSIYQTLLAKPANGKCNLPLTRNDWYE